MIYLSLLAPSMNPTAPKIKNAKIAFTIVASSMILFLPIINV